MLAVWGFGLAWSVLTIFAIGRRAMFRTSAALFLNWLAQVVYYLVTKQSAPWAYFLLIDTLTAIVVLVRPAGKMQAIIGLTLVAQIAWHAAYGLFVLLHGYSWAAHFRYWEVLWWVAAGQLFLMGGWAGGGALRRCYWRIAGRHKPAPSPHLPRMGR